MAKNYELLIHGNNRVSMLKDERVVSMEEMVGTVAVSVYADLIEAEHENNEEKKLKIKEDIGFHITVLNALSGALNAVKGSN